MIDVTRSGDDLLRVLAALANPHRLRILAILAGGRQYVSMLAREVNLSRPLVHLHLQRLEAAGLITGSLELSPDGKAMKWFEVVPFVLHLTPLDIIDRASTLSIPEKPAAATGKDEQ